MSDDEWHMLFTRRTDRVQSHKGQVSFPGGACDEGETTPEQTALREAEEEIGMQPADVQDPWQTQPVDHHQQFSGDSCCGRYPVSVCLQSGNY